MIKNIKTKETIKDIKTLDKKKMLDSFNKKQSINTKNNVGHAATNVTINGHTRYLDTCFDIYVDQIPENFSVDFISSLVQ